MLGRACRARVWRAAGRPRSCSYDRGWAQSAGTSDPPSSVMRAPKRTNVGSEQYACDEGLSLLNPVACSSSVAGTNQKTFVRWARSAVEFIRISMRSSHCETTFSCTFCGRWVDTSR